MDMQVKKFYLQWKMQYLKTTGNQSYIQYDNTGATVSEALGYGMITMVYMAGADPNARKIFDAMVHFYLAHPSNLNPALMAWKQVPAHGQIVDISDQSPAPDADMDIAYALLMADKQWGSRGAINYRGLGIRMVNAIMSVHVNKNFFIIAANEQGGVRSSDFMPDHIRAFLAATRDPRWLKVLVNQRELMKNMVHSYSANTALLPDFLILTSSTTGHPAPPNYMEHATDGQYSWNACRDPWRVATDMVVNGDMTLKPEMDTFNRWVKTMTNGKAGAFMAGYSLSGHALADYPNQAFTAPLMVAAMTGSNQAWLNYLWGYITRQPIQDYYADSIKMLTLLVVSGNWWH
jgi:endoglucanase